MANKTSPPTVALNTGNGGNLDKLETLNSARPSWGPASAMSVPNPGPASGVASSRADDDAYAVRKPHWPKGLALMPHHFEAQDAYHERRTAAALGLIFDQPWGVADLAMNDDSFQAGEIAITRFAGIFPDGTPVSIRGSAGANVLARSFESALRSRETADVYLGVLREMPGRPMVDGAEAVAESRRFARGTAVRPELATGSNPQPVPWLRPNVRILFEGEAVEEYSVLRIARLVRARQGRPVLHRKLVPPVLRLRASPVLQDILQGLEQRLGETRTALAAQRREGQESSKSDAARIVLLMMLGRLGPRVADVLASNVHPREAYTVLAELAGALSPFAPDPTLTIPRFDFFELGTTFDGLAGQIHKVLASITASRYRAVPLTRHDEFLRWADLREPGIFSKQFLLAVNGGDPSRLRLEIPVVAKVAASERIGALINAALAGVTVIPEPHRPPGLEVPPQSVCFRFEQQGDHWDEVVRRGTLGIYLPEPHQRAEISLFVKERGVLE